MEPMKPIPTILIADRNPHVRKFLKRELADSGYRLREVHSAADLIETIFSDNTIALLVLDPDFPCLDTFDLARKIAARIPQIPVVLHGFTGSDELSLFEDAQAVSIEKNGGSVVTLKDTIQRLL